MTLLYIFGIQTASRKKKVTARCRMLCLDEEVIALVSEPSRPLLHIHREVSA